MVCIWRACAKDWRSQKSEVWENIYAFVSNFAYVLFDDSSIDTNHVVYCVSISHLLGYNVTLSLLY